MWFYVGINVLTVCEGNAPLYSLVMYYFAEQCSGEKDALAGVEKE